MNKNGDKTKVISIGCTGQLPDIHQILSRYGIDRICPCLFMFDKLMFAVCEDEDKLHGYVMKDCHHCNCSLMFVCQDLTYKAEKLRMILSNINYMMVFQNIKDEQNLYNVFQIHRRHFRPEDLLTFKEHNSLHTKSTEMSLNSKFFTEIKTVANSLDQRQNQHCRSPSLSSCCVPNCLPGFS